MAIQSINNNSVSSSVQLKSAEKPKLDAKQSNPSPMTETDSINITSTAQDIKNAADAGVLSPAINESRVAALKAAIDAGEYAINPNQIAHKMLQFDTKLPNTT